MKKILICGFPHCGTTILRAIIGHIDDVDQIIDETDHINITSTKKYVLCKFPFTRKVFFEDEYKEYIKIFIIRNPLYVFSSLNKRMNYKLEKDHELEDYIETLKLFINFQKCPCNNIYTIRYEDLFNNNYKKLKVILNKIGFEYTDKIFDNTQYKNISHSTVEKIDYIPLDSEHALYRNWQINRPFVSNNERSRIDLLESQRELILRDEYILSVYPEINDV